MHSTGTGQRTLASPRARAGLGARAPWAEALTDGGGRRGSAGGLVRVGAGADCRWRCRSFFSVPRIGRRTLAAVLEQKPTSSFSVGPPGDFSFAAQL